MIGDSVRKVEGYVASLEKRIVRPFEEFSNTENGENWVILFTRDRKDKIKGTIADIKRLEPNAKLLVVDNGSLDETPALLIQLMKEKVIDKVILNHTSDVPQWQKCFSIAQAFKLLSLQSVSTLTWLDDDMRIREPWIDFSNRIFSALEQENVLLLNLSMDNIQDEIHKTVKIVEVDGRQIKIKESFNGQFVVFRPSLLKVIGLPPIGEGITDAGVEDWYYSRLLQANNIFVGAADFSEHTGYKSSIRDRETSR